jgi:Fis family transcriptional regulator
MSKTSHKNRTKTDFKVSIEACLKKYFDSLNGEKASDLYQMVVGETESALIGAVLEYTQHNQTKAADYLGITRGTLRKKIKLYGLNS